MVVMKIEEIAVLVDQLAVSMVVQRRALVTMSTPMVKCFEMHHMAAAASAAQKDGGKHEGGPPRPRDEEEMDRQDAARVLESVVRFPRSKVATGCMSANGRMLLPALHFACSWCLSSALVRPIIWLVHVLRSVVCLVRYTADVLEFSRWPVSQNTLQQWLQARLISLSFRGDVFVSTRYVSIFLGDWVMHSMSVDTREAVSLLKRK